MFADQTVQGVEFALQVEKIRSLTFQAEQVPLDPFDVEAAETGFFLGGDERFAEPDQADRQPGEKHDGEQERPPVSRPPAAP